MVAISSESEFNGVVIRNAEKATERKSIVICGISRGGTSFAASVLGNLGVPFTREGEAIGRRREHQALRAAFELRDGDMLRDIAEEFSTQHKVWAWKLPAIHKNMEFVSKHVPNPHFVVIFKEPLSVAWRKTDLGGHDTIRELSEVLKVYGSLAKLCGETQHPLMLISYDGALTRMESFLPVVADFAGARSFDVAGAIARIEHDGVRYFEQRGLENKVKRKIKMRDSMQPAPANKDVMEEPSKGAQPADGAGSEVSRPSWYKRLARSWGATG